MTYNSCVNYVEPNASPLRTLKSTDGFSEWASPNDDFSRSPRLEDYSIYFNLEVEVCSRDNISANRKKMSDVLILSYRTKKDGKDSAVNFMGGTKVKCGNSGEGGVQYLTTDYADMYVGDLIDYGTTEMIGVKSVEIEFKNACIPSITVNFTDVRGLSLFQPTELSRTKGIGGINSDNVAQSFFQCFFRVPMPKFTMTIKGFYGKPVTYEVMCDKFDTKFNSSTGNFDITTRFIGYSYSFLTDISVEALLSAPYSDYGGCEQKYNKYWAQQKASGRFALPNKEKTMMKPMPTLLEVWQEMQSLLLRPITVDTSISDEENTHVEEIEELSKIKSLYKIWYETLFEECCNKYGKDYVFLFKSKNGGKDYTRVLILARTESAVSLKDDFSQYSDKFKKVNDDLYAAISNFNDSGTAFKKLKNVSKDFSEYKIQCLFNNTYLGNKGQVVFNGFHKYNKLPETQVVNNVFYGVDYRKRQQGERDEAVRKKEVQHKNHVLTTIYNDGINQYVNCYSIEEDYTAISDRIKALQLDANINRGTKEKKKRIREINRKMFNEEMSWYPTIENFTRIMCAHLETLMHLMYTMVTACGGRTASELGVTVGQDGEMNDVNSSTDVVPPFPRVTKEAITENNETKVEDTWIGEYNWGEKHFEEVDFIDGFFNAAEKMQSLMSSTVIAVSELNKGVDESETTRGTAIKRPLSAFDFYITKNPYGDSSEIANDINLYQLSGKIAVRMYNILALSHIAYEKKGLLSTVEMARNIGAVEAENFYDNVKLANNNIIDMLKDGTIDAKKILEKVTSDIKGAPWGDNMLFAVSKQQYIIPFAYMMAKLNNILYPIQDISFKSLNDMRSFMNQGKMPRSDDSVSLKTLPNNVKESTFSTDNGFGNIYITDDFEIPRKALSNANSESDDKYTDYYNELNKMSEFDDNAYSSFMNVEGRSSLSLFKGLLSKNEYTFSIQDDDKGLLVANDKDGQSFVYNLDLSGFGTAANSKNFNGFTISEIFAISNDGIDFDSSFLKSDRESKSVAFGDMEIGAEQFNVAMALLAIPINSTAMEDVYNKTFIYLPKLCVLKVGLLCFASGGVGKDLEKEELFANIKANLRIKKFASKNDANSDNEKNVKDSPFYGPLKVVINLSRQARYQYAKYFYDWVTCTSLAKTMQKELLDENNYIKPSVETNRALLDERKDFVKALTNELMSAVLVINMSIHVHNGKTDAVPIGVAEAYLESFLGRLKEKLGVTASEDSERTQLKTTEEPKKTTDDMKIELYRYMKQVYDKWIPMSSFENWKLETFFPAEGSPEIGHTFHFIDSYYNYIGDKLLINPRKLSETIDACLSNGDINSMMLGFMSDIYASNRCMLKCIQNFLDLGKGDAMEKMFVPMASDSINWSNEVNKYPSFIVVYPYEPSKNLNVANNEYNDDGFMLNDELETPKAIRSKTDSRYRIPAFGVSYGKQYQSYFKSVNVNMMRPIATEQSIKAKHFIIQQAASSKERGVSAQDLYDIYATNSYTCDVEMMGCAWVQPMMYFVLLNVPMFRGSYMIYSVKHTIRPGDMTTTFTGCRMANVSTRIVEDIFTDNDILQDNGDYDVDDNDRTLKADIGNDCEYKVYPLWEDLDGITDDLDKTIPQELLNKGVEIMGKLYNLGATESSAAGIVGNMYKESSLNYKSVAEDGEYFSGGLCHWRGGNLIALCEKTPLRLGKIEKDGDASCNKLSKEQKKKKKDYWVGRLPNEDYQIEFLVESFLEKNSKDTWIYDNYTLERLNRETSHPAAAAKKFMTYYERPSDNYSHEMDRQKAANSFYSAYMNGSVKGENKSKPKNADPNDNKDINTLFFNALNKSALNTQSIGVELANLGVTKSGYLMIGQKDTKSSKLDVVFDMILNSQYYIHVKKLGYYYPNGGLSVECPPTVIYCKVIENIGDENRFVWFTQDGNKEEEMLPLSLPEGNNTLLKTLAKKYKSFSKQSEFIKEIPQMEDKNNKGNVLPFIENYMPQDCDEMFSTDSGGNNYLNNVNGIGAKLLPSMMIDNWDAGKAANFLINNHLSSTEHICAFAVQQAIKCGGIQFIRADSNYSTGNGYRTALHCLATGNWFLVSSGSTDSDTFKHITPSVGDVLGMTNGKDKGKYGHVCMYCGKEDGWISDFKQKDGPYVYSDSGPGTYWLVRYKGNGKKFFGNIDFCFEGKCLKKVPCS